MNFKVIKDPVAAFNISSFISRISFVAWQVISQDSILYYALPGH